MSYTFLAEQGEESSVACFSEIPVFVRLRKNLFADKFCCNASGTDSCQSSQYGMTLRHSTESRGADLLTSSRAASLAKTSASSERGQASPEQDRGCGAKWRELSVKYNRATHGWKTHQCLWEEDLKPSSLTLPKWGTMRNGELLERITPEHLTSGTESGSGQKWPTPRAGNKSDENEETWQKRKDAGAVSTPPLTLAVKMWPTPRAFMHKDSKIDRGKSNLGEVVVGQLNPTWVEWLMGWPLGWTSLEPIKLDWRDWSVDPADTGDVPRVGTGIKDRAKRLKAIGNGQVPAAAKLAWEALI
jgi:hypothetical protein